MAKAVKSRQCLDCIIHKAIRDRLNANGIFVDCDRLNDTRHSNGCHFARQLSDEKKRHVALDLSEEELAIFDLLTKPEPKLTKKEEQQVKKVAHDLLDTLKREKLVLDWRKRQQSCALVRLAIEEMLDQLPERYSRELYQQKCEVVYQHVYDVYVDAGWNAYAMPMGFQ